MAIEWSVGDGPAVAAGRRGALGAKRVIDVALSVLLIGVLSPLWLPLLLLVASSVRGSPIFRQARRGRDGRMFEVFKLRTMPASVPGEPAPDGAPTFKFADAGSATRLGRLLRRSSLDELPQLVNVLKGEMSLVGPRPFSPAVFSRPDLAVPDRERWMRVRETVRPGITGLWQVSGRSDLPAAELIRLDMEYVEGWRLSSDLLLLLRTVPAVASMRGAY